MLHVLLQGHVLGGEGRLRQELKLALSDSCAAVSEAAVLYMLLHVLLHQKSEDASFAVC